MAFGTHNIQSNKNNRSLQYAPKSRVSSTYNAIKKALNKRSSYGVEVIDNKSSTDRASIRENMSKARSRDLTNSVVAIVVFTASVFGFLYFFGVL